MKEVFDLNVTHLGHGPVRAAWGRNGSLLAVIGTKKQLVVLNKEGTETGGCSLTDTGLTKAKLSTNALIWSHGGSTLAILPALADHLVLWDAAAQTSLKIPVGVHVQQQELTAACWSADDAVLAIGASRGAILLLDVAVKKMQHNLQGVHEKVRSARRWMQL